VVVVFLGGELIVSKFWTGAVVSHAEDGVGADEMAEPTMPVFVADACCVSNGFCTVVAMSAFQWEVGHTKTWIAEVDSRSIDVVKQIMLGPDRRQKYSWPRRCGARGRQGRWSRR